MNILIKLCVASFLVLGGLLFGVAFKNSGLIVSASQKSTHSLLPEMLKGNLVLNFGGREGWMKSEESTYDVPHIYEFSQWAPHKIPTDEQLQAATDLRLKAYIHAQKQGWFDYEKGLKSGYLIRQGLDSVHYINTDYTSDEYVLNPEKPESLMYYPSENGMVLVGVMFGAFDNLVQPGGNLTKWHTHKWSEKPICWEKGVPQQGTTCSPEGMKSEFSPAMLHVWFIGHPQGPFATEMCFDGDIAKGISGLESFALAQKNRARIMEFANKIGTSK